MPSPTLDLTGQRFGRLVALERDRASKPTSSHAYWRCRCDCGNEKTVAGQNLRSGDTKSCGCLAAERVTHGGRNRYRAGCRCDACRAWQRKRNKEYNNRNKEAVAAGSRRWRDANWETFQAINRRWRKRENAKLLERATRHRQPWTGPELELAARRDLSARQIAAILGRTLSSVENMRARLGDDLDPRDRMLAFGPVPPTSRSKPRSPRRRSR